MQGNGANVSARTGTGGGVDEEAADGVQAILERLRREPSLRAWVLSAPTSAFASLGVTLDDHDLVGLLEQVEAMEDERPLPVTAADVMSPDPVTVAPDTSVHEAAQILSERRISGLPVVAGDGSLVGIVSEFDLIARSGATVADVMTRNVTTVRDTASVDQARAVLVSQRLKRVPVLDSAGHLVGLISRADFVRELAYRWQCARCGNLVRSRRPPDGCTRCGATNSFRPAPAPLAAATCPTCGRPLGE